MGTIMANGDTDGEGGRPKTEKDEAFIKAVRSEGVAETTDVIRNVESDTGWLMARMTAIRRLDDLAERQELVRRQRSTSSEWMLPETFEVAVPDELFTRQMKVRFQGAATTEQMADSTGISEWAVLERMQKREEKGEVKAERASEDAPTLWVLKP